MTLHDRKKEYMTLLVLHMTPTKTNFEVLSFDEVHSLGNDTSAFHNYCRVVFLRAQQKSLDGMII